MLRAIALLGIITTASAQNFTAAVVSACGTVPTAGVAGRPAPFTVDTTGKLCTSGTPATGGAAVQGTSNTGLSVTSCGSVTYKAGGAGAPTIDPNGLACTN